MSFKGGQTYNWTSETIGAKKKLSTSRILAVFFPAVEHLPAVTRSMAPTTSSSQLHEAATTTQGLIHAQLTQRMT